jgi:hypothetical protein
VDVNQKNLVDILVSAKWALKVAADTAERLGIDEGQRELWREQERKLSLNVLLRKDGSYGSFEGDEGHAQKAPSQLIGVVMTSLFDGNEAVFSKTFDQLQRAVNLSACAWSPGYYGIAAARLRRSEDALRSLQAAFEFSRPPWILFIENTHQVPGRMPYYLAAHALFVQAINEMFLQDWSGRPDIFPAYPFPAGAFKLRAVDRVIEAHKANGNTEVVSDTRATPLP